ncbi:LOW QUALITY PROTEIN: tudor domain-containing protein 7A [Cottoperca gobio]|uniref:LOW QUALITY PROTEIN: tudor domain-containing protein 7A n=1 Tax=Cottoperca gobio TaxID=56716 RepID=A0A6J2PVP0_COTGO|nr:LOW QUALITY PROTEIN: tudor domain-containing protein 7A-like [Cottoperca gobio]
MSDESIKKMLRSVLQSNKSGVSINNLQSDYRSLCGEIIPLRKLGYSKLEDYLSSIPTVVRLEYGMGEIKCFAAVCRETAHIAVLVAKQKSSKKCGRSQFVNCKMRFKPSNPYMLNVSPRSSLRQPSAGGASNWTANRSRAHGGYRGFSASGDYRQSDQSFSSLTPVQDRQPAPRPAPRPAIKQCFVPDRKEKSFAKCQKPGAESFTSKPPEKISRLGQSQSGLYDVELVQSRITSLLEKYYSGLWMSKLPGFYSERFCQTLHPQVLKDLEKWKHIAMVEKTPSTNRADYLIYPPLLPKPCIVPKSSTTNTPPASPTDSRNITTAISSHPSTPDQPSTPISPSPNPKHSLSTLAKPTFIFPPQPVAASSGKLLSPITLRNPARNPALAPQLPPFVNLAVNFNGGCGDNHNFPTSTHNQSTQPLAPTWTCLASTNAPPFASPLKPGPEIVPLLKVTFSPTSDSVPCPPSTSSSVCVSDEVCQRIKELLLKSSQGMWAHALPKLFMDTYKTPFPEHVLDNMSLLLDICTVEYPMPNDKKRAILYSSSKADMKATNSQQCRRRALPSGLEVQHPVVPPDLLLPSKQFPSVLITEAKSSNAVTIRYVGENYSNSQEAMEEAMRTFYSQRSNHRLLSKPVVGQLAAVRGEDGDEFARAQVMEVMSPNKVTVYYVDYGFSVETSGTNLLEMHQNFLSLPFQAISVRLAGLEAFSSHPLVLSSLDKLVVGKILLMETLEPCHQNETPVAVLYDTSQDDDININSTCMKSLQDVTMNNPLTVHATYQDVCVTNVCADGTIYCQLPSRGTARLSKLLEETETFFISQMTSESLVSIPFSGKFCLARYKGMWSRVEITNMYGNRVIEILFMDFGVAATVEVTDLREIPPLFLQNFIAIPPLAIKCRLADVTVPEGDWSPEAVLSVKEVFLASEDCKMKIFKLDQHKGDCLVYMYLFVGADSQQLDKSVNHQLAQSELWQKLTTQNDNNAITSNNGSVDTGFFLSALVEKLTLSSPAPYPIAESSTQTHHGAEDLSSPDTSTGMQPLPLPPPLEFPQPGQNMDVFVPAACHPGYFVLQPWQDLHKLVVLMEQMILYYNQTWKLNSAPRIQKGEIYAAKIEKNWYRVQLKGILANGLVSVFELDYGKHELARNTFLRPLIEEFRQLPFQAITAQLAGMTQYQWSEEASMLFRNHVEDRALVAQVESVSEVKGEMWERRLTVYLVDTTFEDKDLWIHSLMADISGELSSAA